MMAENATAKMKSLQKSLMVLNCFSDTPLLGVTEISERLGLYKSNVHNILSTLKTMHYLEQDSDSGKYRLSVAVYALCRSLGSTFSIAKVAVPCMQELSDLVNEKVFLAVPSDERMIYLDCTYPKSFHNMPRVITGIYGELYCTALGKAMLAHFPHDERNLYLKRDFTARTEYTITDPDELARELELTRIRGYAKDNMENEFGVRSVAMPIFNKNGTLEAAMSITGPATRMTSDRLEEFAINLKLYVTQIEEHL